MRLRQIEVFHAIYSCGSMTSAAALLNVSQPSVSKVLAHAEQQLGYRLFDRNRGKLVATPEAHQLFKHVVDVYESVDRLRHVASHLGRASDGRVRIASTPAFGVELLPTAVSSFQERHREILFEIETLHMQEINTALLESRIDIGIAFDPVDNPGIEVRPVARSRFVVLAPREGPFEDRSSLSIEDLAGRRFVGLNNRGPLGQLLATKLTGSGVDLDLVAWTETYHIAKALVACGAGISIADEITARSGSDPRVRAIPLQPALTFDICVLHNGNAPLSLPSARFVEHLGTCIHEFLGH